MLTIRPHRAARIAGSTAWDTKNADFRFNLPRLDGIIVAVLLLLVAIREGNYGALKFPKDLAVVLISHWEGNVMEKNREFGFLIDDRANSAERAALEKIFTGYAGGAFAAWRDMSSNRLQDLPDIAAFGSPRRLR
jgi:hypothetical protein